MHMFSREANFFGGHGIWLGASVSPELGLALPTNTTSRHGGVAVAYMGDGSANQGQVYECFTSSFVVEAACPLRH